MPQARKSLHAMVLHGGQLISIAERQITDFKIPVLLLDVAARTGLAQGKLGPEEKGNTMIQRFPGFPAKREFLVNDDIELIIPHQANLRIIEAAARGLKMPMERFVVNLDKYGNTSTASIPLAAAEAAADGRLQRGDNVVLVGFGAGLTWGSAVVRWTGPFEDAPEVRIRRYTRISRLRSLGRRIWRFIEGLLWGRRG